MNRTFEPRHKPGLSYFPKWSAMIILCGFVTLAFYSSWWFQNGRLLSPWLFLGFLTAVLYGTVQLIGSWVLYIAAHYSDRRRL